MIQRAWFSLCALALALTHGPRVFLITLRAVPYYMGDPNRLERLP